MLLDKKGKIIFLNKRGYDILQYEEGELIGKNWFETCLPKKNKEEAYGVFKKLMQGEFEPVEFFENPILTKNGEEKMIVWHNNSLLFNANGKICGSLSSGEDITELKKMDQSALKIISIVDSSDDAIIGKTLDGIITSWNKGAEKIYGYIAEEIIDQPISIIIPSEKHDEIDFILKQIKQGKQIDHFESIRLRKDGLPLNISLTISPIKDVNGKIIGASTIARDITERKKAEQKLKKSEEKSRKAYKRAEFYKDLFTHDINNILQNILSGLQVVELYNNNLEKLEKLNRSIRIIKEQIERGSRLISTIHKLSDLDEIEISLKRIEICSELEKSFVYIKKIYPDRKITVQMDSIGKKLYVQANQFIQDVFINILINAVKYNINPTVELLIKISKTKIESTNYLKMEFQDNSMGIDDSSKNFIFQRGYNEERSIHGMGLGLSLVRRIINAYNGNIWVEDKVKGDYSKGSNFIILFLEAL